MEILRKSEDDFTEEDYEHMKKVRSYIKRHSKQVLEATTTLQDLTAHSGPVNGPTYAEMDMLSSRCDMSNCAGMQRPHKTDEELEHTKWTYSLKNWGHDPMKA